MLAMGSRQKLKAVYSSRGSSSLDPSLEVLVVSRPRHSSSERSSSGMGSFQNRKESYWLLSVSSMVAVQVDGCCLEGAGCRQGIVWAPPGDREVVVLCLCEEAAAPPPSHLNPLSQPRILGQ